MYEELLSEREILPDKVHQKIYVGRTVDTDFSNVLMLIDQFEHYSALEIKEALMNIVYSERTTIAVE